MDRINGAGHVNHLFVAEDAATTRPPTEITEDWLNGVQEELVAGLIEWAGLVANSAVRTQVRQALIAKFAQLVSPALQGVPTAPTAAPGTNTDQVATTAFFQAGIAALLDSAPGTLDTLNELAAALGDDANFAATVTNALALKAALDAVNNFTKAQGVAPVALPAVTGNVAIDFSLSNHFYGQVTGNVTFTNAYTNAGTGRSGMIRVQQDAATLRTWAFGTNWKYVGGASLIPAQTQVLGAYDEIIYHIHSANEISFYVRSDVK